MGHVAYYYPILMYLTDSTVQENLALLLTVSSLWSSGTAVEVHADGPVSIPIASKDEDILHGPYTDMQKSVAHPTKFFKLLLTTVFLLVCEGSLAEGIKDVRFFR